MQTIKSESSTKIVAGKLIKEEIFYVADEAGSLVGKKAHGSQEEAEQEKAGMAGFESGLEFAKAQFPGLGEKAHVGKANVISDYLAWVEAGKPVKEASAPEAEEAPEATEETAAEVNPAAF